MRYERITIVMDLLGCPNRCKHCWLGHAPNPRLSTEDLRFAAEAFRPFCRELSVYDWSREPDFAPDYRDRWILCDKLSTGGQGSREHFELASVWRLARDEAYASWLKSVGVDAVQLTLFGGEETTDWFTGRRGAYQDILVSVDRLLEAGIAPRVQAFVNKRNLEELPAVEDFIRRLHLEERCREIGRDFQCFVHQGSCDGENRQFYPEWITPGDLEKIPPYLLEKTLEHFDAHTPEEVYGVTEAELYRELAEDRSVRSLGAGLTEAVLYIGGDFTVYPNFGEPSQPAWRLGNLKSEGAEAILTALAEDRSPAQKARAGVPLAELVRAVGDPSSQRLFGRGDYIEFLLNAYCKEKDIRKKGASR